MKRFLCALLTLLLVCSFAVSVTADEPVPTFSVSNATADTVNDEITVDISLSNNPGFRAFTLSLDYDDTYLEFVQGTSAIGGMVSATADKVSFIGSNDVTGDCTVCTITLKVTGIPETNTDVTFSVSVDKFGDKQGNPITASTSDGTISLIAYVCPHENTEIRGKVDATCTAEGYTGDTWCTDCETKIKDGTTIPMKAHTYEWRVDKNAGPGETGLKHEECTVCHARRSEGTVIPALPEPEPEHTHSFSKKWTTDASGHWHECGCGAISEYSIHTFKWTVTKEARPTEAGQKEGKCSVCGFTAKEIIPATGGGDEPKPVHTHTFPETWKTTDSMHWQECECGQKANEAEHSFKWVTDKKATSSSTGLKHEECTVCGFKRSVGTVIPKTEKEHTHSYGTEWKSDALNHWHECSCGETTGTAAHTFLWVVDVEATETTDGSRHEECTVCGYAKDPEVIPATGATESEVTPVIESEPTDEPADEPAEFPTLIVVICGILVIGAAVACIIVTKKKR